MQGISKIIGRGEEERMHKTLFVSFAVLAALLNVLPLFLMVESGDAVMNYAQVSCYSQQLWSGTLYPRWCMDANWGMGSPAPIYYFPLPYYISALFYPFRIFGIDVTQQYALSVMLANFITFITCTIWLRRIVGDRLALICAFIFLFTSYRAEISYGRQSYAELWCIAFLPLVFHYVAQIVYGQKKRWPQLSVVLILCMLCHPPATLIGLMAAGLQVLWAKRKIIANMLQLFSATALAFCFTSFMTLSIALLAGSLNAGRGGVSSWRTSWLNSFVDSSTALSKQPTFLFIMALSLLIAFIIATKFWRNRIKLPNDAVRHEAMGWVLIMAFGFIMMTSISQPVWFVVELVSQVKTPWRMMSLVMFGMVFLIAVSIKWVWNSKPKSQTGDRIAICVGFVFFSLLYLGGVKEENLSLFSDVIHGQPLTHYFNTKELDEQYSNMDRFYESFVDIPDRKQVAFVRGTGAANIVQWNQDGIVLDVNAKNQSTIRLEHLYFPIWKASLDGTALNIGVEKEKARMLFEVPAGNHQIQLHQDYFSMLPRWYHVVWVLMVGSSLIIALGFRKNKLA